jgi:hypothetical protein
MRHDRPTRATASEYENAAVTTVSETLSCNEPEAVQLLLARAQVYATLAHAAAVREVVEVLYSSRKY